MVVTDLNERTSDLVTRTPDEDVDYYFLSLFGDSNGKLICSCYSEWIGFADNDIHVELRKASVIRADITAETFRNIGETVYVLHEAADFTVYSSLGGHALIEKNLAENLIADWLEPIAGVALGMGGFIQVSDVPKGVLNKAPTKKLRMQILQRDRYCCKICGRRPADHVDVELHIHHILPWALGGLTMQNNLMTMCHTCHLGLDPHFNPDLFSLVPQSKPNFTVDHHVAEHVNGVRLYRENLQKYFEE